MNDRAKPGARPLHEEQTRTREPIVKATLGADWARVPSVLQRNFNLRPGRDCAVNLEGRMYEIWHSPLAKAYIFAGRLLGALVPYQGENVPVRIELRTNTDDRRFMHWRRIHYFPGRRPCIFSSKMEFIAGNELVECVRLGFGMRMQVSLQEDRLEFVSPGYQWNVLGMRLRMPGWLLLGTGRIIERGVSEDEFEMFFDICHPVFGKMFSYCGIFHFVETQQEKH